MRRLRGREGEGDEGHGGRESEAREGGDNGDGRRVQRSHGGESERREGDYPRKDCGAEGYGGRYGEKGYGFLDWQERRNRGEGSGDRGARLEPDEEPVFVYCGATAPPRRFSEPETAAALIEDFQEKYGCVILSETFKTPLSPTLRGETRAGRGGRVCLFRRHRDASRNQTRRRY
ncbi:hypothetical protein U1Q18_028884 [Sarracenia purpurea var. burkii]